MNFSRFLDIQSWWEVPSIAYFCSLFRTAFNLLDFDIEELEEALLTDGTEESASSLLTELIVRLLNGCLGNNDISAFNYQMYLRRLFRRKCQETGRYNPFNTDIDFQFLPLRTKVEILYALCDFRLDAEDVFDLFKNLEAESLRVEPLGFDDKDSAYWYFYGTRLYREDIIKKPKAKNKKKKVKETRKRGWFYGDDWLDDDETERVWQVVCFTEEDWAHLTEKFSKASSKVEKELYRSLSQNFLPEIPRLFQEKERLQRKRLLEHVPRRTSSRVLQKIKQKEEEEGRLTTNDSKDEEESKEAPDLARENRAKRRNLLSFSQTEEDVQIDMYKVLEQLTAHEDAWPFMDPVEEEYAPNYYAVIRRPMDLHKMEERLDRGHYTDFSMFQADFKLIVNNCRLYNGQDNEYTLMVDNLQAAFGRLTEKYIHRLSSSDEEIAVEYQIPTPSRKHKLKNAESPSRHKRKKRKCHLDTGDAKTNSTDTVQDEKQEDELQDKEIKKTKESHKSKQSKGKKKRKGHHRHGKHSKNHKKESHKSDHSEPFKSKHNKKQKHGKNKEGKKSKQKKKKSKHHELESEANVLKRSISCESLESSNRSRSASPLPSIHTPTPSPTDLQLTEPPEQLTDPDFYKDKYDKIKERRRHAAKEAWDSLFDYKQKTFDKQKQNLHIPEKDKNQKLRETIEKLKAKNEKYKDNAMFNRLFSPAHNSTNKDSNTIPKQCSSKEVDGIICSDDENSINPKSKSGHKKCIKKITAKNESASEALEQAVKDISKWLDEAPKTSTTSSPCDSPAQTISTEEQDNSRLDDEFPQTEKSLHMKKDISRKRQLSRDAKLGKRREIQRTIDRLQPGKSKGNLLTNMNVKSLDKIEETPPLGSNNKLRDISKGDEVSPKLSLGSVLATVEFTLGNDHNFEKGENTKMVDTEELSKNNEIESTKPDQKKEEPEIIETEETTTPNKKDAEVETEPTVINKPSQEKATPNLSAWFKAFGTPKNTTTTSIMKRKVDDSEIDDKPAESNSDLKASSPKTKYDAINEPDTPNPDGGDSPLPNINATPRQRRTSTGSSVSERSSFSQDLDSPRHQISHTSPLLRSPASPRTEDFQKITYPIINGTVRAGFYQDTTSIKSSPEKSCSPREAPQSPYSPYSQHVYATNNTMGSSTPNYFVDNKSPLPTYGQNPPPYYDTSKAPVINKPIRVHDDYTALGPDTYPPNQFSAPFSTTTSPYVQNQSSHYAQSQISAAADTTPSNTGPVTVDTKNALFPVKKRTYNEPDIGLISTKLVMETKDSPESIIKNDYSKPVHNIPTLPSAPIDDIATVLNEKTDVAKISSIHEKSIEFVDRHNVDNSNHKPTYDKNDNTLAKNKDYPIVDINEPIGMIKRDGMDLINMGYLNHDGERRNSGVDSNDFTVAKDITLKSTQAKGYEVDTIAMNLGLNNIHLQKQTNKTNISNMSNIPPAHSNERSHIELNLNQNLVNAHQIHYDTGQSISNFSLNDIELANKKLYACNSTSSPPAIDYGNWKMTNQIRKTDVLPSDYSTNYNTTEKNKNETNVSLVSSSTYNKNLQQQYHNYNKPRAGNQRTQDPQLNLQSELKIPNPRGILKAEHSKIIITSSVSNTESNNKNTEVVAKLQQKSEKLSQNHPLVNSSQYKTFSGHSSIPMDIRNLPNIPQMLERYTNNERYLSSFAASNSALYNDKTFQMAQMFNKPSDVLPTSTSVNMYSQPSVTISKDSSIYKSTSATSTIQTETKTKNKRKRITESKQSTIIGTQGYHTSPCNSDMLSSSAKTSIVPGSAFNFGTTPNMSLAGGLYGDNSAFSIEDFRSSTNQLMAANYMAAAVAHQQQQHRSSADGNPEKLAKPAHQNSSHTSGSFPFIGHSQVRAGYPFVSAESPSPLYQQYLQRHQEELLRQTGAQIMGLYPPGYPATLSGRQPYDLNRHSWL